MIVRKQRGLSELNDWRSIAYVTREKFLDSDQEIFIKIFF